ncbi:unnamed protein product [Ceutorhynchus assimilis]|uniref:Major facilitator superfamily (MFS) profile domain-containing protein n=1 Tax=Ceutorhynchus assimilis TaxID=467358 RepID=A0A9N9QT43_9CUCU|nr:unnamed protein product [Ceutorhynchus assimilis]
MPMVIGITILAFASEVKLYYLGRLLYGIGNGGVFTVLTMYTGEITAEHNRGKFSCILGIFVALGVLYPFSIGTMLSIKVFCLSCLVPLTLFIVLFTIFAPDSPTYLVRKGLYNEAEVALHNLRNIARDQAKKEVEELQRIEERQGREKGGVVVLFRGKGTRKGFMVAAGLLILQQFSGINAVIGFMEGIFRASGSSVPTQMATTFVGSIQVVTVFLTASIIEKLGRKFLLLISTIGSAVSIILLGLYFFLQKLQFAMLAYFWWFPITCLILYMISFNLGLGPVPWTILSEIFPDNVKSSALALASGTCFGVSFVVTMAFPIISEMLGMAQSFWLFGVCCVIGIVFIQFVVPETKGKKVAEIQEMLSR